VVQVPLECNIGLSSGAFYIYREAQERYIPVKFSVRGRDLGGAVSAGEGRRRNAAAQWLSSGLGGRLRQSRGPWRVSASPCRSPSLILLLLYVGFGSLTDTLIAGSAIPLALVGGIDLFLADMPFHFRLPSVLSPCSASPP
jgi:cobalt-zinc-cadmium resistance protein CzcA